MSLGTKIDAGLGVAALSLSAGVAQVASVLASPEWAGAIATGAASILGAGLSAAWRVRARRIDGHPIGLWDTLLTFVSGAVAAAYFGPPITEIVSAAPGPTAGSWVTFLVGFGGSKALERLADGDILQDLIRRAVGGRK